MKTPTSSLLDCKTLSVFLPACLNVAQHTGQAERRVCLRCVKRASALLLCRQAPHRKEVHFVSEVCQWIDQTTWRRKDPSDDLVVHMWLSGVNGCHGNLTFLQLLHLSIHPGCYWEHDIKVYTDSWMNRVHFGGRRSGSSGLMFILSCTLKLWGFSRPAVNRRKTQIS